jgi:hypothetical protein
MKEFNVLLKKDLQTEVLNKKIYSDVEEFEGMFGMELGLIGQGFGGSFYSKLPKPSSFEGTFGWSWMGIFLARPGVVNRN